MKHHKNGGDIVSAKRVGWIDSILPCVSWTAWFWPRPLTHWDTPFSSWRLLTWSRTLKQTLTKLLKEFHISEKCKQRANTEKQINHNIANTAFGSIQGVSVSIMIWYSLLFSSWRPQSPPDCSAGARPWCRCTGKGQGQCVIKGKLLNYRHVTFVQGHAIILATYEASH